MKDADLVFLVNIINQLDLEMSATFFVNGLIISGDVISGQAYYEKTIEDFKKAGVAGEALSSYFTDTLEKFYTAKEGVEIPDNFIHIKNARVSNAGEHSADYGSTTIRLKIEEINGSCFGKSS